VNGVLRHPADCGAVLFWTQSGFIARILNGHLRVPPRGARHTGSAIRNPSTGSKVIPGSITSANSFRQSTGNSVGIPFGSWRLTGRRENRLPATTGEPSRTAGTRSAPMGFWWSSSEIRAARSSPPRNTGRTRAECSVAWQSCRDPANPRGRIRAPGSGRAGPRGCPTGLEAWRVRSDWSSEPPCCQSTNVSTRGPPTRPLWSGQWATALRRFIVYQAWPPGLRVRLAG
jgi:hypothetical protein